MAQLNLKVIEVAVAVIQNSNGEILITRRSLTTSHPGMWEFPGGKLDENESAPQAIYRETLEEIGLEVKKAQKLTEIYHTYPNKNVILHVYKVDKYIGKAVCREQQIDLKWVKLADLNNYEFPEANIQIISLIQQVKNRDRTIIEHMI